MTAGDRETQVAHFCAWRRKRGGPWEESFAVWARSKALQPRDEIAIRSMVAAELAAAGHLAITDIWGLPT